jgi:divinyl protochlorophyllide a 8-vinyl-reductase
MAALAPDRARIGPNAVLQHLPVLQEELGEALAGALLHRAGIDDPGPDASMLPEDDVARLHHAVRLYLPDRAARIQRQAGLGTAAYILANRIPPLARTLIRILPAPLGARLLAAAIAKHAWTFAGSGRFRVLGHGPLRMQIAANPLAVGPTDTPICDWHAAVFEGLFQALVWPRARVSEDACTAMGDSACEFTIWSR